jgi:TonB family protein
MNKKIKIMKTKPEVTEEEIRSYMDFDRLLETHRQRPGSLKPPTQNIIWLISAVMLLGALTLVVIVRSDSENTATVNQKSNDEIARSSKDSIKASIPEKPNAPVAVDSVTLKQSPLLKSEGKRSTDKNKVTQKESELKDGTVQDTFAKSQAIKPVYVQAEPVDGYPNLYRYFSSELRYPQEAIKDSIRGEVIAVFSINMHGVPEKISIEQSLGPVFDQEVIRLITNMPAWKPATYNDKPVASKMSLPLTFQIKKITSQK